MTTQAVDGAHQARWVVMTAGGFVARSTSAHAGVGIARRAYGQRGPMAAAAAGRGGDYRGGDH
ncbi:hypothetical protein Dda_5444 [Drechslerella dactyloides]|uniref:Uncharacterized protein n=1 Tax=Drechslerella dactyloides TaxID=74499 RepID=A0AAD6IW37_DREDA|nr:hypothetical protein Dda_5444 [Drechslerella dactyloides]